MSAIAKFVRTKSCAEILYRWQSHYSEIFSNPPITHYWTVPLIVDHSNLVEKSTSSKIGDEKIGGESVRILEVLKLLFQQILNLSSSQRDMSGPILGDLSNNR
jgi:hypothetical protein